MHHNEGCFRPADPPDGGGRTAGLGQPRRTWFRRTTPTIPGGGPESLRCPRSVVDESPRPRGRAVAITIGQSAFLPTPWLTRGRGVLGRARLRASLSKLKATSRAPVMRHTAVSTRLRLDDVRRAWESRDPELTRLVGELAGQDDETPGTPRARGADVREVPGRDPRPVLRAQAAGGAGALPNRAAQGARSPTAEVPLPDRLRLHEIVTALWEDNGPFARSCCGDHRPGCRCGTAPGGP